MTTKTSVKNTAFLIDFFSQPNSKRNMPAAKDKRKLYKCVKKTFDDVTYLCVKFKNLNNKDIREVREEINHLLKDFWAPEETEEKSVKFEDDK